MKAILINEERLDELVNAMLNKMEADAQRERSGEPCLTFGRVNYDVRILLDKIKKETL